MYNEDQLIWRIVMYSHVQPFITENNTVPFHELYAYYQQCLFALLDSPVKSTQHIGGTRHLSYPTEPILDILVGVDNLHDITSLDEKRLNYEGFYRLHHQYQKKVIMAKFNNLIDLKQEVRLHILQRNTPLFQQYQQVDHLLSTQIEIQTRFSTQKQSIVQLNPTIRDYENQKLKIFSQISQYL